MDDIQGMHKTNAIRVDTGLECRSVHQEANRIVGNQQAVQFLNYPDGLQTAQGAACQVCLSSLRNTSGPRSSCAAIAVILRAKSRII